MTTDIPTVRETAERLARSNKEAEPSIEEIWFFPDANEIRLLEIDSTLPTDNEIAPFHFPADPLKGIFYPVAIALISRDDMKCQLPDGWVAWEHAVQLL